MDLEKSSLRHPYLSAGMDRRAGRHSRTRDEVQENLTIGNDNFYRGMLCPKALSKRGVILQEICSLVFLWTLHSTN